ncbi:MAG: hypothetical protein WD069_07985 [Planctomycetales bacterium]
MAELLADGAAWLAGTMKEHNARAVTYRRGASEVVLSATVGRTEFDQATEEGFETTYRVRDYLIPAADLVLDGAPVLPQAGDVIEETAGGITYWYRVLPDPSGSISGSRTRSARC